MTITKNKGHEVAFIKVTLKEKTNKYFEKSFYYFEDLE